MKMVIMKKIALVALAILIGVISVTVVTPWYTKTETHKDEIAQIDSEITKVMGLTGAAAGASAVISLLPDDNCTPIADQLAEFSKYFLVVLSALYLEKYLITVFGYAAFTFIIPLACVFFAVWVFVRKDSLKAITKRLLIGAAVLALLIPTSTKVSELIQNTYDDNIEETIQEAERITVAADDEEEDEKWYEKFTQWLSSAAVTVSDYVTGLLSKFIESLAVMLVTSCLIPILVVVIFVWLMKTFVGAPMPIDIDAIVDKMKGRKPKKPEELLD